MGVLVFNWFKYYFYYYPRIKFFKKYKSYAKWMYKQKRNEELQFIKVRLFSKRMHPDELDYEFKKLKIQLRNIP